MHMYYLQIITCLVLKGKPEMYVFAMKKSSCLETDSNKKVNFLSILGSHNALQFDWSQKASIFKTPPLFNLNVSTHNDALKNKNKKNDALRWQKVQELCRNSN